MSTFVVNTQLTKKAADFLSVLPHCKILGLEVDGVTDDHLLTMTLPYSEQIIGNPLTGVIHGGPLTTLMDTACGTAVFTTLPGNELCPTLDLRVDYMRTSEPGSTLYAEAKVTRISKCVVFTHCNVYQYESGHPDRDLVATCTAAFMRLNPETVRGKFVGSNRKGQTSGEETK